MRLANESDGCALPGFAVGKRGNVLLGVRFVLCFLVLALIASADAMQVPSAAAGNKAALPKARTNRRMAKAHATQARSGKASQPDAGAATDASAAAPKPASVTLEDGVLTVKAKDSDLRQILDNIAVLGSMSIEGQISESRVYGSYGPGVPSSVILNLLEGAGYNVILSGVNRQGVPRKLVLTPKTGGVSPPSEPARAAQTAQPDGPEVNTSDGEPLGPGAIANAPPPPSENQETRMKQTLDRLQQMQDQQKQPQDPLQQQPQQASPQPPQEPPQSL